MSTSAKAAFKILEVDDDVAMRETLRDLLEAEGYAIIEAPDGVGMQACLKREAVDLITLDLRLGGEDGLALARDVRSHCNIPIIMISGRDEIIDRVLGLELGADDYISKPFHVREVLARVRAVLRRYGRIARGAIWRRHNESIEREVHVRWLDGGSGAAGASLADGRADWADDSRIRPTRVVCKASAQGPDARDHPRSHEGACVVTARSNGGRHDR